MASVKAQAEPEAGAALKHPSSAHGTEMRRHWRYIEQTSRLPHSVAIREAITLRDRLASCAGRP